MVTNTCKNKFLENDGYCTQCGKNHLKIKKSPAPRPEPTDEEIFEEFKDLLIPLFELNLSARLNQLNNQPQKITYDMHM